VLPLFDRTTRLPVLIGDALDRGAVVLTANLRAARALEQAYAEDQRSRGIPAWPRPRILDWNSWIAGLWEQYARRAEHAPMPLSPLQEHQLWSRVQGADRDRVVAPDRMADLAQEAYGLLGSYRAHPLRREAASGAPHEDAERFLAWADSFDRACERHRWVSRTRLDERLTRSLEALDPIPELCLTGFDRTTPAQLALLEAFQAAGTTVTRFPAPASAQKSVLLPAKDQRAELEACAWWCRAQLAQDASCRIGVIAPDLGRVRADLDRVFRRILMPQTTLLTSPEAPPEPAPPYEFSLGTSLATLPMIRAALLLLRWLTRPLAAAELTWLLTSGFLAASAADQRALARLDRELRRSASSPEVSLPWLLAQPRRNLPAELRTRLLRVQARIANARGQASAHGPDPDRRASHAHWAELIPSLLSEAGWPGFREADSFTFQTEQRWTALLGELAELGFDGSQPTWTEFLRTLEAQAHAVIFAAESTTPPIQVLGAFESSGQSFDALWFLGVDDTHWPAVGRPHPLLPAWLQREAKMPHASPEADWILAQQATARILGSAPLVVVSHPLQDTGLALRPSTLLLPHTSAAGALPAAPASILRAVRLEAVLDDSGTLPWPAQQSAGGAEILKRQAACAFQSFAMRRLEARPLEQPAQGLDPAERGTQLHAVLERLWSAEAGDPLRLHTRDDLQRATADASLTAILAHHIHAVFAPLADDAPGDMWTQAYLACEQQRVHDRLLAWLGCELQRHSFTVEALEKQVDQMLVGQLRLKVRLDRVDHLADGTRLLVDYKTGKVNTNAWMGDRPEEPQLPLYAIFGGIPEVSGIAFAQIRADETRLLARAADAPAMVSAELGPVSNKNHLDDAVRDGWQQALLALADQFLRGEAGVNPRDGAKTCKYCPLTGLCRVHAAGTLREQEDESRE
jgi:ATP-dependent helicase/nuclease subunit B